MHAHAEEFGTGLLLVGLVFLAGLAADVIGRRTGLPRVTLLIATGIGLGPHGLALLPAISFDALALVSIVTLTFVAFLLGAAFELTRLRSYAREVLVVSLTVTIVTALVVGVSVAAAGLGLAVALALAGIATATDPIATQDVVEQTSSRHPFAQRLSAIVAIDDAWGILAFSLLMSVAGLSGMGVAEALSSGAREIFGALALGAVLAVPMVALTGRVAAGEPTLAEALGFVLICAGAATVLGVSPLLAAMTMGAVTINFARHHNRPFHAIEGIEWPLLITFFVLTGAAVEVARVDEVALMTAVYCGARVAGRWIGGILGGRLSGLPPRERRLTGVALLPQAGVALGMALVASQHLPDLGPSFLSSVAVSTILFELAGPVITRRAILAQEPGDALKKS